MLRPKPKHFPTFMGLPAARCHRVVAAHAGGVDEIVLRQGLGCGRYQAGSRVVVSDHGLYVLMMVSVWNYIFIYIYIYIFMMI